MARKWVLESNGVWATSILGQALQLRQNPENPEVVNMSS